MTDHTLNQVPLDATMKMDSQDSITLRGCSVNGQIKDKFHVALTKN